MRHPLEPLPRKGLITEPGRKALIADVRRWPDTCHFCGAPIIQNQCPRCSYVKPKQGEVVWTGVQGTGAASVPVGPPFTGSRTVIGTGTSSTGSISLPSKTLPAGSCIVCGIVVNSSNGGANPRITFGGQSKTWFTDANGIEVSAGGGTFEVFLLILPNISAGTNATVIDDLAYPGDATAEMSVWASYWTGLTASPLDTLGTCGLPGLNTKPIGISPAGAQSTELIVMCVGTTPEPLDAGTWDSPSNSGQSINFTGSMTLGDSTNTEGWRAVQTTESYTMSKTLGTAKTWGTAMLRLKAA